MSSSIRNGRLFAIEDLKDCKEGDSIRVLGVVQIEDSKIFIKSSTNTVYEITFPDSVQTIIDNSPYLLIGEIKNSRLNIRISKSITFKKYNIDHYLKILSNLILD